MVIIYIIAGFLVYFIPTLASSGKKHSNGIFVLNLFLGWTFLGWVAALVWAVADDKMPQEPTK